MRRYLSASPPGYGRCPCVMHIARPARGRTIESGLRKAATAPLTKQMATHAASAELRRRRNLKTVSACFLCLRPTPPCVVLISTTIATNHCCQYGSRVIPYAASQSPHTHSHKPARTGGARVSFSSSPVDACSVGIPRTMALMDTGCTSGDVVQRDTAALPAKPCRGDEDDTAATIPERARPVFANRPRRPTCQVIPHTPAPAIRTPGQQCNALPQRSSRTSSRTVVPCTPSRKRASKRGAPPPMWPKPCRGLGCPSAPASPRRVSPPFSTRDSRGLWSCCGPTWTPCP